MFLITLAFTLVGCSNGKIVQPDSTDNAALLMNQSIVNQNYNAFQSLLTESKKESISEETFKRFGEISTSSANFKTYELLTFTNGEMLLLEFEPVMEEGIDYKIVSIKIVPEEMKTLFERK
ncbi:MAG: hypothetical protein K0S51_2162 [Bacillales bacterium]|jgi:hypothetical protein|nr:hypothetical protein [Bacillales bacterium]